MQKTAYVWLASAMLASATPALAADGQSAQIVAERRDYSDGFGELNTVVGELVARQGDMTLVLEPRWGERRSRTVSRDSVGIGASAYYSLSPAVSTRTRLAAAQDEPVFARIDAAQDVTFRIAPSTTATFGARYARYFGGGDVYFVTGGARYYFKGGSIAYRLSHIDPDHRDEIWAHLVQVTVNDAAGRGKTQLWLAAGESALEDAVFVDQASGDDYSAYLRRYQPITDEVDLIGNLGISSYDRPGGRITAPTIGIGIRIAR